MACKLADLATLVEGQLDGDGAVSITDAATLATARPGQITLVDAEEKVSKLAECAASALVVGRGVQVQLPNIQVDDVHEAFARIVAYFRPPRQQSRVGRSPQATISSSASLGQDVDVYPGVVVGEEVEIGDGSTIHTGVQIMAGCKLGKNVTVFPGAVLYENTIVGDGSVIHANAVLGAYGFGYDQVDGRHQLSAQLGYVEIGADVEIGACSTIDRGTYGPTVVGEGTKIDNQVMVGHNCCIGRHNLICSQVGIAGSTTTGDYVVMAGQVGVRDHVHIGSHAVLCAKAGVSNDVRPGAAMLGTPATLLREQKIKFAGVAKLPELRRKVKALQAAVDQLQRQMGTGDQPAAA